MLWDLLEQSRAAARTFLGRTPGLRCPSHHAGGMELMSTCSNHTVALGELIHADGACLVVNGLILDRYFWLRLCGRSWWCRRSNTWLLSRRREWLPELVVYHKPETTLVTHQVDRPTRQSVSCGLNKLSQSLPIWVWLVQDIFLGWSWCCLLCLCDDGIGFVIYTSRLFICTSCLLEDSLCPSSTSRKSVLCNFYELTRDSLIPWMRLGTNPDMKSVSFLMNSMRYAWRE